MSEACGRHPVCRLVRCDISVYLADDGWEQSCLHSRNHFELTSFTIDLHEMRLEDPQVGEGTWLDIDRDTQPKPA